jgi:glycosyltransferase involved in cell wall biosynthesis
LPPCGTPPNASPPASAGYSGADVGNVMTAARPGAAPQRTVLAVVANPIWPITNGYSLRASRLLRELAQLRRVVLAGPTGALSPDALEQALGVARVVPITQFRGWDTRFSDDDRRDIFATIDRVVGDERPSAAVVWPGADILLGHPRLPSHVLDRMDSEVVMAWRDARVAHSLKDRLRALRSLARWVRNERAFVRGAAATIVDAEADARAMRLVSGKSNVHVVASAVDVKPLSPAADEAPHPTVAFTGSMAYSANVDAVLWFATRAWPSIRERVPSARFVIAGRSPAPAVAALASTPGIEVHADVPDMLAVLRNAWITICPVQTGSGIRTKVLESWSVGRPVVMSRVGATGLHLDDDTRSLVIDDARATAERIVRLLSDASERHRLGAAVHRLASTAHNGWAKPAKQLSELLDAAAR